MSVQLGHKQRIPERLVRESGATALALGYEPWF